MFEYQLIAEVEKCPNIYDKDHINFRNKVVRDQTWREIGSAVGETEEKCRVRWRSLRDRYVKENLYMLASRAKYKSIWKFTNAMSFMADYIDQRQDLKPLNESSSKTSAEFLINEVRKRLLLYDKDHRDYRNRELRDQAWESIASEVGASDHQCRNRWKNLRDRAVREHQKIAADPDYKPQWKFHDSMSFMKFYSDSIQNYKEKQVIKINKRDMFCRTCLNQILNENGSKRDSKIYNIFKTSMLEEKLKNCSNLPAESSDEYPHSVCGKCYEKILDFHQFQQTCFDSLEKFFELLENEPDMKNEFDSEDTIEKHLSLQPDATDISYIEVEENMSENSYDEFKCIKEQLEKVENDIKREIEEIASDADDDDDDPLAETCRINKHFLNMQDTEGDWYSDGCEENVEPPKDSRKETNNKTNRNTNTSVETYEIKIAKLKGGISLSKKPEKASKEKTINLTTSTEQNDELDILEGSETTTVPIKSIRRAAPLFKCDICPKTFNLRYLLKAHRRLHIFRKYPCTYGNCQSTFTNLEDLQRHLDDHNSSSFKCNIGGCEKQYRTRYNLHQHKIRHHNCPKKRQEYICEECGEEFENAIKLRTHRSVHNDKSVWPYVCDVDGCEQRFRRPCLLEVHKKRHFGIKDHICPYCAFRTFTSTEMNIHINTHTFERKYPCSFCSRVFKTSIYRANHTRRVHKSVFYQCNFCEKQFKTHYSRRHHEMSHQGIIPYPCDQCDKKFKWTSGLKRHKQRVHMGGFIEDDEEEDEALESEIKCERLFEREDDDEMEIMQLEEEYLGEEYQAVELIYSDNEELNNLIEDDADYIEYTFLT